jgi:hypothetical protein
VQGGEAEGDGIGGVEGIELVVVDVVGKVVDVVGGVVKAGDIRKAKGRENEMKSEIPNHEHDAVETPDTLNHVFSLADASLTRLGSLTRDHVTHLVLTR